MIELAWPPDDPPGRSRTVSSSRTLPLRTFVREILHRSCARYFTLILALYYLAALRYRLTEYKAVARQSSEDIVLPKALQCGRRMFLAALAIASKYLHDRNRKSSTGTWSGLSGLNFREINANEMAFLAAIDWKLHVTVEVWAKWQEVILRQALHLDACAHNTWESVLQSFTPHLDMINVGCLFPLQSNSTYTVNEQFVQRRRIE